MSLRRLLGMQDGTGDAVSQELDERILAESVEIFEFDDEASSEKTSAAPITTPSQAEDAPNAVGESKQSNLIAVEAPIPQVHAAATSETVDEIRERNLHIDIDDEIAEVALPSLLRKLQLQSLLTNETFLQECATVALDLTKSNNVHVPTDDELLALFNLVAGKSPETSPPPLLSPSLNTSPDWTESLTNLSVVREYNSSPGAAGIFKKSPRKFTFELPVVVPYESDRAIVKR
jgi:hypothetical protein